MRRKYMLKKHLNKCKVVVINKFKTDTDAEIAVIREEALAFFIKIR